MKHPNNNSAIVIRPAWTIGNGPKEFGMAYFNSSIRKKRNILRKRGLLN